MEKLIERIEEYIRECGSFNIENVDTPKKVFYGGTEITYFDLGTARVGQGKNANFVFYHDLDEDTLLEILYIAMEWKHKWDEKEKNENHD